MTHLDIVLCFVEEAAGVAKAKKAEADKARGQLLLSNNLGFRV